MTFLSESSRLILLATEWAIWALVTIAIMLLDARRQRARALATGEPDFKDRSPASYLALALVFGPLPLLVYFGTTRRSAAGWLLGLAAAAGVVLLVGVTNVVLWHALSEPITEESIEAIHADVPPEREARFTAAQKRMDGYVPTLLAIAADTPCADDGTRHLRAPPESDLATLERDAAVIQLSVVCSVIDDIPAQFKVSERDWSELHTGFVWQMRSEPLRAFAGGYGRETYDANRAGCILVNRDDADSMHCWSEPGHARRIFVNLDLRPLP